MLLFLAGRSERMIAGSAPIHRPRALERRMREFNDRRREYQPRRLMLILAFASV